jgi:hypothetical protein
MPFNIQQDAQSNYVLSATMQETNKKGAKYYEYALMKLDSRGSLLWDTRFHKMSETGMVYPNVFSPTKDGGFVTCVLVDTTVMDNKQRLMKRMAVLMKFDAAGKRLWQKSVEEGSIGLLVPPRVNLQANGNINLVALSLEHVSGFKFMPTSYFIQFDASGNKITKYNLGNIAAVSVIEMTQNTFTLLGGMEEEGKSGAGAQARKGFVVMKIRTD